MKNILVAGYPRSGNTYLGYLLSYTFNAPYYDLHDLPKVLAGTLDWKDMTLVPDAFSGSFDRSDQINEVNAVLKTHSLPKGFETVHRSGLDYVSYHPSEPLVLISREPKDVAVSYFYYHFFRRSFRRKRWHKFVPNSTRQWYYRKYRFHSFAVRIAKEWNEFTMQWVRKEPTIVTYDELIAKPLRNIETISLQNDLYFDQKYGIQAVEFCKLSKMRQAESDRHKGKIRESERKYREGRTGSWEQFFSPELRKEFDKITQQGKTALDAKKNNLPGQ